MPSHRTASAFLRVGALATVGATAMLAAEFYQRPLETSVKAARLALLATGAREGTIEANGLPIHYYCAGRRGVPLIMLHGLGSSAEGWLNLLPRLSKDYLVYAPDLPGFGRTPLAPGPQRIATHVAYLEHFLNALGYPRVMLVGNSFGGWIAARFAIDHPERVSHLYLLNSAGLVREGFFSPYAPDRDAARRYYKRMWNTSLPIPTFLLDAMVRSSQQPAYTEFLRHYDGSEELDADLAKIRTPTTIIWGAADHIFPLICAEDFHKGIPGSRLILLNGVGHTPQFEAGREVARIIRHDTPM